MSRGLVRALGPFAGLLAVWTLFAVLAGGPFTALENQRLMLLQTAVVGTAALGATFVIATGGIDLSVGAAIALGTVVVALLLEAGAGPVGAALGGVAVGLVLGALVGAAVVGRLWALAAAAVAGPVGAFAVAHQGPWVGTAAALAAFALAAPLLARVAPRVPLSPFVVTLGLYASLRGAAKGLGDNRPVYADPNGLEDLMSSAAAVAGLPVGVWVLLALALALSLVLDRTPFGRQVLAVGSNERVARLCGVPVERTKLAVYCLASGCAGLAAVLQFSYLTMGDPTTAGGYELAVIAAVIIGGGSLAGGEGSIRGTLVGALLMTCVANGCVKLGLANWVQEVVTGGIIVAAVVLDRLRRR